MADDRPRTGEAGRDLRHWLTVPPIVSRSGSLWRRSRVLTLLLVDRKRAQILLRIQNQS